LAEEPIDYSALPVEELIAEIKREEELLDGFRDLLAEAETRRDETLRAIEEERLPFYAERYRRRQERIRELERALTEYDRQIAYWESRVARRETIIRDLEASIARLEARLAIPWLSPTERLITRETIRRLRRSLAAHRGWLTRETRTLSRLKELREWTRRRIAAYRGWQIREEPYVTRLRELRADLSRWEAEIARLQEEIRKTEEELKKKREALPKFWKSHVIISLDYDGEHYFELHIIYPHLEPELTDDDKKTLATLSFELMSDYGVPDEFLYDPKTELNFGEVQTKPVKEFNRTTEAVIFDVKTTGSPCRRVYHITWYIETTLEGQRFIRYKDFTEVGIKKTMEEVKEEYERLVSEEVEGEGESS